MEVYKHMICIIYIEICSLVSELANSANPFQSSLTPGTSKAEIPVPRVGIAHTVRQDVDFGGAWHPEFVSTQE